MSECGQLTSFIDQCNVVKKVKPFYGRILALDPGETTGFAVFDSLPKAGRRVDWVEIDQVKTGNPEEAVEALVRLFDECRPDRVVYESYHVYDWKKEQHVWSPVFTVQVIGCIWTLCRLRKIPFSTQSAQNAKGFWTDDMLTKYHLYQRGLRHGRDATRHALHFLCFGESKSHG
jgi:hypothetical protein